MYTADAPIGVRHRAETNDKTGLTEIVISSRPKPPTAGAASIVGTRGRISRKGTGSVRNLRIELYLKTTNLTVTKRDMWVRYVGNPRGVLSFRVLAKALGRASH